MNDNLIIMSEAKGVDIPVDRVLASAIGELKEVVIIGTFKDGREYFASSLSDGPSVNWMLDRAKKALIDIVDEEFTNLAKP